MVTTTLVFVRQGDSEAEVCIPATAPLATAFALYASFKRLALSDCCFYSTHTTPPLRLDDDTDTPTALGLPNGARIACTPFVPFQPDHVEHCDVAFRVDGCTFRGHKYPILRTASPLLAAMVEMNDGSAIELAPPGGDSAGSRS